jgi:hypothetical protein
MSERPPTIEAQSKNQEYSWEIYDKESVYEKIEEFESAYDHEDEELIIQNLRDPKFLRTSIINRGEQNNNLLLLQKAFDLILQNQFGPDESVLTLSSQEIIDFIKEAEIPEQILAELTSIGYHTKNGQLLYRVLEIINEAEENGILQNSTVSLTAHHNEATWLASRMDNQEDLALQINQELAKQAQEQEVAKQAKEEDAKRIGLKSSFGVAYNKPNLKPLQRVEDFHKIAIGMQEIGHDYDAIRAIIESTFWRYNYSIQKDTPNHLRKEHIDQAHGDALDALKYSLDINYKVFLLLYN